MDDEQKESRDATDHGHGNQLGDEPAPERRRQPRHRERGTIALTQRDELEQSAVVERGIDADVGSDEKHQQERARYRKGRSEHPQKRVLSPAELAGDLSAKISSGRNLLGPSRGLFDD